MVATLGAAVGGYRVGLLARVLSWVGLLLGVLLAAQRMPQILHVLGNPPPGRAGAEVAVVLVVAGVLGKLAGVSIGIWAHRRLPARPLRTADRVSGAAVGVAGVAALTWVTIPLLAEVPGWPAEQSRRSAIGRAVADHAPRPPAALSELRGWLDGGAFPRVLEALRPTPAPGPEEIPEATGLRSGVAERVAASVLLVRGQACRYVETGTGFAIAPGRVVTNAHVVAGATALTVTTGDGTRHTATLRAFDADRDLALLRVPGLDVAPLERASGEPERGSPAAVFGHPGGGPLRVAPARVRSALPAVGRDIYDRARTRRNVLVLAANLREGDSGSPVVDVFGRVVGVAFAVAPDRADTAYALAAAELDAFIADPPLTDSTGPCLVS